MKSKTKKIIASVLKQNGFKPPFVIKSIKVAQVYHQDYISEEYLKKLEESQKAENAGVLRETEGIGIEAKEKEKEMKRVLLSNGKIATIRYTPSNAKISVPQSDILAQPPIINFYQTNGILDEATIDGAIIDEAKCIKLGIDAQSLKVECFLICKKYKKNKDIMDYSTEFSITRRESKSRKKIILNI